MEEQKETVGAELEICAQRLSKAAEALEQVLTKLETQYRSLDQKVERIAASIEEMETKPAVKEIAAEAKEAKSETQRRTVSSRMTTLLAKQGVELKHAMDAEALDEALRPLSVEQRIAVKMELSRSGALS